MITKETLRLEIEKHPDGSFRWYDILTKQPVETYSPFKCVKASAMSVAGERFEMLTPIPPKAFEDDGPNINEVVEQLALNAANHPEFIGTWGDEQIKEMMDQLAGQEI